ncbi:MAG: TRAP transporter substrate-binding protein [Burkholderiales bacterium]|nr:TRAP transporter substrate-binding protein [Burkholderiales bacterium]
MRLMPLVLTAAALAAALPAAAQEKIKLRVMGMPLSTGMIHKNKEQPFFETLAAKTGLPLDVDYKPLDSTGVKEFEQLRVMKTGIYDIVGLRMGQVSRDEPTILGLDLVGLNTDYKTAKKVVGAYQSFVDLRLQEQFNLKLLGVWPFGPQVIFCKPPIKDLASLKGMKVRILDGVMAKFMERVGATPVTMAFGEVAQGLKLGTIDCAVTGPSSANSAGWPETATHMYVLGLQVAVQGYAINMNSWKKMSSDQQIKLRGAIEGLTDDIWKYSEELWSDGVRCNTGQEPCTTGKKFKMTLVKPTPKDVAFVQNAVKDISLPAWAEACDKVNPNCSANWKKTVGPIIGIK